ncbi:MAG: tagaturonate epimerase family protein [Acidobacteriia bacterium]|nr:tagaturonate epimerase family protein [Terriglobia bacterium]
MTPVPLDLPLRPSEASELGNLIFDQAERKPLTDEVRNRIAARASVLRLETIRPYFGSLERDPVHPSVYYLAVDGEKGEPLLLHLALATAPTSSIFYKPLLIGRMRRPNGPEMVVNSIPFGASDGDNLEKFCARIDTAFLPRPQGSRTAIAIGGDHPESVLPAAFDAFRAILKRTGKNLAATALPPARGSARHFYCAGLWAAIRAGWREGYSAGAEIAVSGNTLETAKEAIHQTAVFSSFGADACRLFHVAADPRHPSAWSDAVVEEKFESCFTADDRGWIFDEFARAFDPGDAVYEFTQPEVLRLAVKFGPALRAVEQIHESIRQTRSTLKIGRSFDFDVLLEGAGAPTTPEELIFCLHWLKQRGHAAQLATPGLGGLEPSGPAVGSTADLAQHIKELSGIARHYQAGLTIRSRADHGPEVLDLIGRATVGRVNYKVSDELDVAGHIRSAAEHLVG